jgi:Ca2+-binding RTX toxin-like protein
LGDAIVCPLVHDTGASACGFSCFPGRKEPQDATRDSLADGIGHGSGDRKRGGPGPGRNLPHGANGLCVGTVENDTLNGTNSADDMRDLKGQDTLNTAADFYLLAGGRGNDILKGEADNDSLSGDLGDETAFRDPGLDTVQGCESLRR